MFVCEELRDEFSRRLESSTEPCASYNIGLPCFFITKYILKLSMAFKISIVLEGYYV